MIKRMVAGRKGRISLMLPVFFALLLSTVPARAAVENLPAQLPVPGTVTLVELGADNCLPCRLLAPILEELKQEYKGKAAIVHIDVYRQREEAGKFHALVTPTLIYFDRQGREMSRFAGFEDKAAIVKKLNQLLAQ